MAPALAPMLVMITAILTAGGVVVFRPLSRRLADLLHAMAQQRLGASAGGDAQRTNETIALLEQRISLLEDRLSFTESLLDRRLPPDLGASPLTSADGLRRLQ